MNLRLQTDYALRTLMFLGYVDRKATAEEIANKFDVSKDHLVKVIQQLSRFGLVNTIPGRGGGLLLAHDAVDIQVRDVIEKMEGRNGVLRCVTEPSVCPLEPGCKLRRLLMTAENAFYEALDGVTIADLCRGKGGLTNLQLHK